MVDKAPESIISGISSHKHEAFQPRQLIEWNTEVKDCGPDSRTVSRRKDRMLNLSPSLSLRIIGRGIEAPAEIKIVPATC
jgi:hypothetical protein